MLAGGQEGVADRVQVRFDPAFSRLTDQQRGPLPVPSTSIYTRTDGVVRWQTGLDVVDDRHENVEVRGSHRGLAYHLPALYVVAARLGQREGVWRSFSPPLSTSRLYPKAVSWQG
jgi:hypothetical protein